jgi:hypothetical protein
MNVIPIKRRVNRREGGYFVVFIKERKVNSPDFCCDHWEGSPYILINLRITNANKTPAPAVRNIFFLFSAAIPNSSPHANPASIIPSHGISGYAVKAEKSGVICIRNGRNNTEEKNIAAGFAGIVTYCKRL